MAGRMSSWTAQVAMSFIPAGSACGIDYAEGRIKTRNDIDAHLKKEAGNVQVRSYDSKTPNLLMVLGEPICF